MRTLRTIPEVRAALTTTRQSERRIALVPTMGAFHDGHVSLMRAARSEADVVVVSLFVNPTQFGPGEDLDRYPRTESDDGARASGIGVDFLFAPAVEEMYPPGFASSIDPGPVAHGLWGSARPGHFAGVATVVARLFGIVAPDIAYFGLKDYQQVAVIRRIVADLALPVEIRALPTVREPDGLAMSSRNRFLSADDRERARAIFHGLRTAADAYATGERDHRRLIDGARSVMEDGGLVVEFVELRDAETLGPYSAERAAVLAVSARAGDTNLIDNLVLTPQLTAAPRTIQSWSTR
ncbi:MAG: pantoate--beta-alanine ligase [Gaiellaceae bacterium]|nr:pantoate--beta-alanine ligase [Gaiellaceae bacterium]